MRHCLCIYSVRVIVALVSVWEFIEHEGSRFKNEIMWFHLYFVFDKNKLLSIHVFMAWVIMHFIAV